MLSSASNKPTNRRYQSIYAQAPPKTAKPAIQKARELLRVAIKNGTIKDLLWGKDWSILRKKQLQQAANKAKGNNSNKDKKKEAVEELPGSDEIKVWNDVLMVRARGVRSVYSLQHNHQLLEELAMAEQEEEEEEDEEQDEDGENNKEGSGKEDVASKSSRGRSSHSRHRRRHHHRHRSRSKDSSRGSSNMSAAASQVLLDGKEEGEDQAASSSTVKRHRHHHRHRHKDEKANKNTAAVASDDFFNSSSMQLLSQQLKKPRKVSEIIRMTSRQQPPPQLSISLRLGRTGGGGGGGEDRKEDDSLSSSGSSDSSYDEADGQTGSGSSSDSEERPEVDEEGREKEVRWKGVLQTNGSSNNNNKQHRQRQRPYVNKAAQIELSLASVLGGLSGGARRGGGGGAGAASSSSSQLQQGQDDQPSPIIPHTNPFLQQAIHRRASIANHQSMDVVSSLFAMSNELRVERENIMAFTEGGGGEAFLNRRATLKYHEELDEVAANRADALLTARRAAILRLKKVAATKYKTYSTSALARYATFYDVLRMTNEQIESSLREDFYRAYRTKPYTVQADGSILGLDPPPGANNTGAAGGTGGGGAVLREEADSEDDDEDDEEGADVLGHGHALESMFEENLGLLFATKQRLADEMSEVASEHGGGGGGGGGHHLQRPGTSTSQAGRDVGLAASSHTPTTTAAHDPHEGERSQLHSNNQRNLSLMIEKMKAMGIYNEDKFRYTYGVGTGGGMSTVASTPRIGGRGGSSKGSGSDEASTSPRTKKIVTLELQVEEGEEEDDGEAEEEGGQEEAAANKSGGGKKARSLREDVLRARHQPSLMAKHSHGSPLQRWLLDDHQQKTAAGASRYHLDPLENGHDQGEGEEPAVIAVLRKASRRESTLTKVTLGERRATLTGEEEGDGEMKEGSYSSSSEGEEKDKSSQATREEGTRAEAARNDADSEEEKEEVKDITGKKKQEKPKVGQKRERKTSSHHHYPHHRHHSKKAIPSSPSGSPIDGNKLLAYRDANQRLQEKIKALDRKLLALEEEEEKGKEQQAMHSSGESGGSEDHHGKRRKRKRKQQQEERQEEQSFFLTEPIATVDLQHCLEDEVEKVWLENWQKKEQQRIAPTSLDPISTADYLAVLTQQQGPDDVKERKKEEQEQQLARPLVYGHHSGHVAATKGKGMGPEKDKDKRIRQLDLHEQRSQRQRRHRRHRRHRIEQRWQSAARDWEQEVAEYQLLQRQLMEQAAAEPGAAPPSFSAIGQAAIAAGVASSPEGFHLLYYGRQQLERYGLDKRRCHYRRYDHPKRRYPRLHKTRDVHKELSFEVETRCLHLTIYEGNTVLEQQAVAIESVYLIDGQEGFIALHTHDLAQAPPTGLLGVFSLAAWLQVEEEINHSLWARDAVFSFPHYPNLSLVPQRARATIVPGVEQRPPDLLVNRRHDKAKLQLRIEQLRQAEEAAAGKAKDGGRYRRLVPDRSQQAQLLDEMKTRYPRQLQRLQEHEVQEKKRLRREAKSQKKRLEQERRRQELHLVDPAAAEALALSLTVDDSSSSSSPSSQEEDDKEAEHIPTPALLPLVKAEPQQQLPFTAPAPAVQSATSPPRQANDQLLVKSQTWSPRMMLLQQMLLQQQHGQTEGHEATLTSQPPPLWIEKMSKSLSLFPLPNRQTEGGGSHTVDSHVPGYQASGYVAHGEAVQFTLLGVAPGTGHHPTTADGRPIITPTLPLPFLSPSRPRIPKPSRSHHRIARLPPPTKLTTTIRQDVFASRRSQQDKPSGLTEGGGGRAVVHGEPVVATVAPRDRPVSTVASSTVSHSWGGSALRPSTRSRPSSSHGQETGGGEDGEGVASDDLYGYGGMDAELHQASYTSSHSHEEEDDDETGGLPATAPLPPPFALDFKHMFRINIQTPVVAPEEEKEVEEDEVAQQQPQDLEALPFSFDLQIVLLVESRRIMQLYFTKKFLQLDLAVNVHLTFYDARESLLETPSLYGIILVSYLDLQRYGMKEALALVLPPELDRMRYSIVVYDVGGQDEEEEEGQEEGKDRKKKPLTKKQQRRKARRKAKRKAKRAQFSEEEMERYQIAKIARRNKRKMLEQRQKDDEEGGEEELKGGPVRPGSEVVNIVRHQRSSSGDDGSVSDDGQVEKQEAGKKGGLNMSDSSSDSSGEEQERIGGGEKDEDDDEDDDEDYIDDEIEILAELESYGVTDVLYPPYTVSALKGILAAHQRKQEIRQQFVTKTRPSHMSTTTSDTKSSLSYSGLG